MNHEQHQSHPRAAAAGAAIYSRPLLAVYDVLVIRLSNELAWRCPATHTLELYRRHLSANHLDVGVGTGYYLAKSRFPTETPRLALWDLNSNSLQVAAQRLRRYAPSVRHVNVLEPVPRDAPAFDSIAVNYLLHCVPGTMRSKQVVFDQLVPWLNDGGVVFGSTILGQGTRQNGLARRLLAQYNARGIFSNRHDTLHDLETNLHRSFRSYWTQIVGCVALFVAQR